MPASETKVATSVRPAPSMLPIEGPSAWAGADMPGSCRRGDLREPRRAPGSSFSLQSTTEDALMPTLTTREHGEIHRPVPSDRRHRHLRLEPRIMFLPCPLHILLPRYPRVLGAGLHLSQLSHFRGPPQSTMYEATRLVRPLPSENG